MNALQKASNSVNDLTDLLSLAREAREAFAQRRATPGFGKGRTQVVMGKGMARVVEAGTGKCLGFRQSYKEARWLQQALENGTHPQSA